MSRSVDMSLTGQFLVVFVVLSECSTYYSMQTGHHPSSTSIIQLETSFQRDMCHKRKDDAPSLPDIIRCCHRYAEEFMTYLTFVHSVFSAWSLSGGVTTCKIETRVTAYNIETRIAACRSTNVVTIKSPKCVRQHDLAALYMLLITCNY